MVIGKANRSHPSTRLAGAAVALSAALLAGCAAGQRAQTSVERPVIDGVNARTTNVSVNDLSVSPPSSGSSYQAGDNAPLQLVLVNTGATLMQLASVTVDESVATSASVSPSLLPDTGVSTADSGSTSPTATTSDSDSAAPTGSESGSAAASSTPPAGSSQSDSTSDVASASAVPTPASVPIPIPVGSSVRVGLPGASASIVLNDLAKPLYPAQNITIVFNFSDGQSLSVLANVHLDAGDSAAPTLPVSLDEG